MSLKQFFFALCLGAVLVQAGLQCARAEPAYEVVLEDEYGNQLPAYAHRGERFAEGRDGQRYNVRVYNHTGRRVEAVVSVDGRDVLSGNAGDYKRQRGYIVPAYGSVLIDGFRTSLESVAAFRFTDPGDSYSSRMGTPENVGVIGAAFFSEYSPPPPPVVRPQIPRRPYPPFDRYDSYEGSGAGGGGLGTRGRDAAPRSAPAAEQRRSAPSKGSAAEPAPSSSYYEREESKRDDTSNIGTAYGEERHSQVSEVTFVRASGKSPDRLITLRYDDREGLFARGVLPRPQPRHARGPSAFPANRFAPPPPARPYEY